MYFYCNLALVHMHQQYATTATQHEGMQQFITAATTCHALRHPPAFMYGDQWCPLLVHEQAECLVEHGEIEGLCCPAHHHCIWVLLRQVLEVGQGVGVQQQQWAESALLQQLPSST